MTSALRYPVLLFIACMALLLVGALFVSGAVFAQESVSFPVAELGNCESKEDCKSYCDDPSNIEACMAFAEAHGLVSEEDEEERARIFAAIGGVGPGGCTSVRSCEAYCDDVNNINECIAFGEAHGLIPDEDLDEARRVAQALASGAALPGGCTTPRSCEAYCSNVSNMQECLAFAESAGLMSEEELAEARKISAYLEGGGQMPGGCSNEAECKAYCESGDHIEECMAFAEGAGFMTPEEAELFRKTGGRGPGGCRGEECETFCDDPANRQACFDFAREHGLLSEEDMRRMEEGMESMQRAFDEAPPVIRECILEKLGVDADDLENRAQELGAQFGEEIHQCFEAHRDALKQPGAFREDFEGEYHEGFEGDRGQFNPPPGAHSCIAELYGADAFEQMMREGRSAEAERRIEECMRRKMEQQMQYAPQQFDNYGEFEGMHDAYGDGPYPGEFENTEPYRDFERYEQFEGGGFDEYHDSGTDPSDMPSDEFNRPEEFEQFDSYEPPPDYGTYEQDEPVHDEPTSMHRAFMAHVLTIVERLLGN